MVRPDIKVVSWDVDGTLYAFAPMIKAARRLVIKEFMSRRCLEVYREMRCLGRVGKELERVQNSSGLVADMRYPAEPEVVRAMMRHWMAQFLERVGPRKGLKELLSWSSSLGLKNIALSDYVAEYKLEALGIREHFDHVYAGEIVGHVKPSAAIFNHVTAQLNVPPENILHIGDMHHLDGGCEKTGWHFVHFDETVDTETLSKDLQQILKKT